MLTPGPKSPGMNIDVYLQPLIDELKDLWEKGALTWDAKVRKIFTLRAVLLWTINDFLHMPCCLVGVLKASLHVLTVISLQSTYG